MSSLAEKEAITIEPGSVPLKGDKITNLSEELGHTWAIINEHHIEREFKFDNFVNALEFTNKVGNIAEELNHHPEIWLTWGKVKVSIFTHSLGGLTENDFIFAAKCDRSFA